jgi:hypothetical protein
MLWFSTLVVSPIGDNRATQDAGLRLSLIIAQSVFWAAFPGGVFLRGNVWEEEISVLVEVRFSRDPTVRLVLTEQRAQPGLPPPALQQLLRRRP